MTISSRSSRVPETSADSTVGSASSFSSSRSASLNSRRSGISPERTMVSDGLRAVEASWTIGSRVSSGRSVLAMSTFSRTWRIAFSLSKLTSNSRPILATPSTVVAVIFFSPSMVRSCVSIGRTSSRSASSGLMPGWITVILTNGNWMSGSASRGIEVKARKPISSVAAIIA